MNRVPHSFPNGSLIPDSGIPGPAPRNGQDTSDLGAPGARPVTCSFENQADLLKGDTT